MFQFSEAPEYRNNGECPIYSNRELVYSCDQSLVHIAMTLDSEYLRGSIAVVHSVLRHASCPENSFFHFSAAVITDFNALLGKVRLAIMISPIAAAAKPGRLPEYLALLSLNTSIISLQLVQNLALFKTVRPKVQGKLSLALSATQYPIFLPDLMNRSCKGGVALVIRYCTLVRILLSSETLKGLRLFGIKKLEGMFRFLYQLQKHEADHPGRL